MVGHVVKYTTTQRKKDRRCRMMSEEYGDNGRWAMQSLGCRVSYSSGVRVEKVSFITE